MAAKPVLPEKLDALMPGPIKSGACRLIMQNPHRRGYTRVSGSLASGNFSVHFYGLEETTETAPDFGNRTQWFKTQVADANDQKRGVIVVDTPNSDLTILSIPMTQVAALASQPSEDATYTVDVPLPAQGDAGGESASEKGAASDE